MFKSKFKEILVDSNAVNYDIMRTKEIITKLSELHNDFSLHNKHINTLNLKKRQVRDVMERMEGTNSYVINKEFLTSLKQYIDSLSFLTIEIDFEYTYTDLDFRMRVKQMESIIYKLNHYRVEKREEGSIAINKCLNDLLGFRIVLPNFEHDCNEFNNLCSEIRKLYRIRYRNSSKGKYVATHVYFHGGTNLYFPWELQIWRPENYETNYSSHAAHKQEYIKSAKIHKDALGKGW